jgi:hypothetical protein
MLMLARVYVAKHIDAHSNTITRALWHVQDETKLDWLKGSI